MSWAAGCARTPPAVTTFSTATGRASPRGRVAGRCSSRGRTGSRTAATSSTGERHQLPLTEPERRNAIHGLVRRERWTAAEREPGSRRDGARAPPAARLPVLARPPDRVRALRRRACASRRPRPTSGPTPARTEPARTRTSPSALRRSTRPCSRLPREPCSTPTSAASRPAARPSRARSATSAAAAARRDGPRPRVHRPRARRRTASPASGSRTPETGRAVTVWVDGSYPYLMLFTGDPLPDVSRRSLAVEPMTCPPNAFRTGEARDPARARRLGDGRLGHLPGRGARLARPGCDSPRVHDRRPRARPVRDDVALPLPLRPADARPRAARRGHADALAPHRRRAVAAADAVLRDAVPDQLRDRRRDRPRPGVPVRDELVGLLEVRRQRVRRAARDRGPRRLLPRVDVPRALDLRLEPALAAPAPGDALDRGARHLDVGLLHPRRELVDAGPGRLQDRERPGGADERLGAALERLGALRVRAHDLRRADRRRRGRLRRLLLALRRAAATSSCSSPRRSSR